LVTTSPAVIGLKSITFLVKHNVRDGDGLIPQTDVGLSLPEAKLGAQVTKRPVCAHFRCRGMADSIDEGHKSAMINRR
jgi:hypothetical protein